MSPMNLQCCGTSLATIVVMVSCLAKSTTCAPAEAGYAPAEQPRLLLWVDQRMPELENEMFDSGNDPGSTVVRTKRIGSLSIVNSLDVLRQRVLLELARRKALQDQRQIDANRRILESIGKRSVHRLYNAGEIGNELLLGRNGLELQFPLATQQNSQRGLRSERIPERTEDWLLEPAPQLPGKTNNIAARSPYHFSS